MRMVFCLLALMVAGCGGSGTSPTSNAAPQLTSNETTANDADYKILFIGNSHTAYNNLPDMVMGLIQGSDLNKTAYAERVPEYLFLSDHAKSATTLAQIESRDWTHVILQAQKYSQSFTIDYPISGALTLIDKAQSENTQVIMFPEWAQRNRPEETEYIHNIHARIARNGNSCVAPVGYAWERALAIRPDLTLHASDGNHASLTGSFLTALVMYETITGEPADLLQSSDAWNIEFDVQDFLAQATSYAHANHPACDY